jgi:hypothetical protein
MGTQIFLGSENSFATPPIPEEGQSAHSSSEVRTKAEGGALQSTASASADDCMPPLSGSALILDIGGANTGAESGVIGAKWASSNLGDKSSSERERDKAYFRKVRKIKYNMLNWMRQKRMLVWLTLTSSRVSDPKKLRDNFQNLRERLEVKHGWARNSIQYLCVQTTEGFGVLHIIMALPIAPRWYGFDLRGIGEWWAELHGARQIKWKEVNQGSIDAARISSYMLSQYTAGQNQTVRFSCSRGLPDFTSIEKDFQNAVFGHAAYTRSVFNTERYLKLRNRVNELMKSEEGSVEHAESMSCLDAIDKLISQYYRGLYKEVRVGMTALLLTGEVWIDDRQYVLFEYKLLEV